MSFFDNKTLPKISIITPSYNQGTYLERTILSVISQHYPNLEYIIIDGGSTDESVDIINKYEKHLAYWTSEKDKGMYEAIQKGFAKSSGEIMGWINSDDLLHSQSLFVLADIFANNAAVNWLHGWASLADEQGRIVYNRRPNVSKYSFYMKEYHKDRNYFIQQESTFWRRSLWEKAGAKVSENYRLAGDFELWMRFFRYDTLYITHALLGAFRVRKSGQASKEHYDEYLQEVDHIVDTYLKELDEHERHQIQILKRYKKYISKIPLLRTLYTKKHHALFAGGKELKFDFNEQHFYL